MQALTIAQAGAEGVYAAIADGMKAGMLARVIREKDDEIELLKAKCEALENDSAVKDKELARLRRENRKYRFSRSRAYANALEAQAASWATRKERFYGGLVLVGFGAVLTFVLVFAVLWGAGV